MMTSTGPDEYNYATFPPATDAAHFRRFAEHLKVGQPAPDFTALQLQDDGGTTAVALSALVAQHDLVVLEFGSIT